MTWYLGIAKLFTIFMVITCIEWVDITGDGGWVTEEEIGEPTKVTSCGIFVKEDDDFLYLAMDKTDEEEPHYNSTGVFPKGVILKSITIEIDGKKVRIKHESEKD